jgi:hypothetical protein
MRIPRQRIHRISVPHDNDRHQVVHCWFRLHKYSPPVNPPNPILFREVEKEKIAHFESWQRPYFSLQPPELLGCDVCNISVSNPLFVVFEVCHRIPGFGFYPGNHIHIGTNLVHVDAELVYRAFGITGIRHDCDFQMLWTVKLQLLFSDGFNFRATGS